MKPEIGLRAAVVLSSLFASAALADPEPPAEQPAQQQAEQQAEAAAVAETTAPPATESSEAMKVPSNPLGLPQGWSGAIELGLSGSDGNTQNFNMRSALDLNRKVGLADSTLRLTYRRAADGGQVSANRFVADARHEQLLAEKSRWRYFLNGTYEYDDFQDWRQRLTLNAGVGYALIDTKQTQLIGRLGAGANKRWGGADENWTPEGLVGATFEHKFSERTSIYAGVVVLPDISTSGEFRVNSRGGVKITVDPQLGLNLHIGFEDRYDSNPGPGSNPNDIDYFVLLGWKF